ncbi:MFS transporter [Micromonospora sp. NPDC007230]|uniref:MFS transporter n=1 Tax=Micromonospora sp. NPDC007230 TaxID=3364237 RepID=UPI0036AABAA2
MSTAEPAPPATTPARYPRAFASMENRTFRMLLVGWLAAGTGYWMQLLAQNWLVLTLTNSPSAVGLVTAAQLLPTLLLGLHGGAIADTFPCRRIVLVTNSAKCVLAAAFAMLTASGHVEVWEVTCLAIALGVVYAIDSPARHSFLTETVQASHLRNAISLVSLAFQLGAMIGPALGGVLMVTFGTDYAFGAAAIAYVVPATVAARLPSATSRTHVSAAPRTGVREGLRYAIRTPTVLWPSLIVGSFGFFMVNLPATLTTFAKDEFDSGPTGVALLSISLAAGSLLGALLTARRTRPLRLRTIAGSAMLLALALLLAAAAHTQTILALLLTAVGATYLALLTSAQSLVQLTTTDTLRGRVIGTHLFVFLGSGCAGGPALGLLTEHLGARATLLLASAIPALITTIIAHHLARLANLRVGLTTISVQLQRPTLVPRS